MEARRGFGFRGFFVLGILVIAVAAASGVIPFRQVLAQERSIDLAVRQRDALIEENLRLEQQIAALQSSAEVERLAREQFGLVKPGETSYLAVPIENGPSIAEPEVVFSERTSWWKVFWDFITGRDLVGDE